MTKHKPHKAELTIAALRDAKLSPSSAQVLFAVQHHPMTNGQIADHIDMIQPGVTSAITLLEKRGLVTRQNCPKDRRRVIVTITDKGKQTLHSIKTA